MHEERDTLWHFVMSIVKYRESHYVTILDMYGVCPISVTIAHNSVSFCNALGNKSIPPKVKLRDYS